MASSGTFSFAPSNGELALAAFERIFVRAPELRQEHMLSVRRELNLLFGQWSNQGPNLWEVIRTQTVLTAGQATYSIPPQTVMILDASVVLNINTQFESRRYITPISRTEYLSYANQQSQGQPTVYWFDRLIAPTLTFYLVPDANGPYTFDYFSVTQIQDANLAGGETPNVPYRWYDAIVAGLAFRLSRIYPPSLPNVNPLELRNTLKADADEAWRIAATQDTENVPLVLAPDLTMYYRH
jgi:hypothetical protein